MQRIALVVIVAAIIGGIITYNLYIEQLKVKGQTFGNALQQIQEDVKTLGSNFESKIIQMEEGDLTKQEVLEYSQEYFAELENLIPRYDELVPPEPFSGSVELFKLSTRAQLESDREYIKWIETQDDSFKVRSESLLQESFDYEMAALADYQAAQTGLNP